MNGRLMAVWEQLGSALGELCPAGAFDVHQHLGNLGSLSRSYGPRESNISTEATTRELLDERLRFMGRFGIRQATLLPPGNGDFGRSLHAFNDAIADATAESAEFPVGFGTVDLWSGPRAVAEARRALGDLGLRGIAWHHRLQGAFIDHPLMDAILEVVAEFNGVAAIHAIAESSLEAIWQAEILVERFPTVRFLILDGFSAPTQAKSLKQLALRHDNVWFDTGAMISVAHDLEGFVSEVGDSRLLFGSDLYMDPRTYNVPFPLLEIAMSDLSDDSKRRILGDNARNFFGLA